METSSKLIGDGLRQIFAPFTRQAMGWRLIDAFAHLEEREEALRDGNGNNDDFRRLRRKVAEDAP
jgi:hypothetical protein